MNGAWKRAEIQHRESPSLSTSRTTFSICSPMAKQAPITPSPPPLLPPPHPAPSFFPFRPLPPLLPLPPRPFFFDALSTPLGPLGGPPGRLPPRFEGPRTRPNPPRVRPMRRPSGKQAAGGVCLGAAIGANSGSNSARRARKGKRRRSLVEKRRGASADGAGEGPAAARARTAAGQGREGRKKGEVMRLWEKRNRGDFVRLLLPILAVSLLRFIFFPLWYFYHVTCVRVPFSSLAPAHRLRRQPFCRRPQRAPRGASSRRRPRAPCRGRP